MLDPDRAEERSREAVSRRLFEMEEVEAGLHMTTRLKAVAPARRSSGRRGLGACARSWRGSSWTPCSTCRRWTVVEEVVINKEAADAGSAPPLKIYAEREDENRNADRVRWARQADRNRTVFELCAASVSDRTPWDRSKRRV